MSKNFIIITVIFFSPILLFPSAGITPYIKIDGQIYFLLSVEKRYTNKKPYICITDFGGRGPTTIKTAAKEGYEETMGIFTTKNIEHLKKEKKAGVNFFIQNFKNKKSLIIGNKNYKTFFIDITQAAIELTHNNPENIKNTILNTLETRLIKLKSLEKFKNKFDEYREKIGFVLIKREDFIAMVKTPHIALHKTKVHTSFVPQPQYYFLKLKLYGPFVQLLQKDNAYLKLLNL